MEPVKSGKVNVGLVGSGFITAIHTDALKRCGDAQILGVASPSKDNAKNFARKHGIANSFKDYRKLLEMDEIDLIVLGIPNDLHCQATLEAAAAGKHVIIEKPLCMNLAEADRMIAACKKAKV